MRRILAVSLSCLLVASIVAGCNKRQAKNDDPVPDPIAKVDPPKPNDPKKDPKKQDDPPQQSVDAEKERKFNDALNRGLIAVANDDRAEALAAFELALSLKDDELVKAEIAKLKDRVDLESTTKVTLKNIETVINEGKADEAVKLVNAALKDFGDGDDADKLVQFRLQADALQAVQNNEDNDARYKRFRAEGEAAVKENNLRAAALAFEQALVAKDDAILQDDYNKVRASLERYDSLRKKAAEQRRDPTQLEDAVETLKQAKDTWDTVQIRNDLDETLLALQKRRDAVSVADFDVGNGLGVADAGAAFADEILPRLKTKYNLVERAQIQRVIKELGLDDVNGQQEQLGQLAKVRYLVVGSVRAIGGITVQARLIDVRTGLVVQTAKIVAPTVEEALNQAPDLAKQLLMTDEEKALFDLDMQQKAAIKVAVVAPDEMVKPAPLPPQQGEMIQKPRLLNPAPPLFGNVAPDAPAKLPPPPAQVVAPPIDLPPPQMRQRVLIASLEMGDDLFRAGRFAEAQRHFEFALNLAPDNFDIRLRLQNLRPLLPPPVVVPVVRPRLVVLPFVNVGQPRVVPAYLSHWTPTNLSPYFLSRYDVVDPAEIYWFMGRMGITMHDLMTNPDARRWLGRAAGVRYFVLGSHVQTTSFDVNAYLVDAEFGYLVGQARIHVQNQWELRLRLQELATICMMTPMERAFYFEAQRQRQFEQLVISGKAALNNRQYARAVDDLTAALQIRPGVVAVQWDLQMARDALWIETTQIERKRLVEAQILAAQRGRQQQLAHDAELARRQAIADAAARTPAQQKTFIDVRLQAQNKMITQAEFALKTKNFGISVGLFQGAIGIGVGIGSPQPAVFQDFAQARLEAERAAAQREAALAKARFEVAEAKRQADLLAAQKALAAEQEKQKQDAARAAILKHDKSVFDAAMTQGNSLMAQGKNEPAIVAFQGAERVAHGSEQLQEVRVKLDILMQRQAAALAKSEAERKAIETKLAVERARRKAAEAQAKQADDAYKLAMLLAEKALADKDYDAAHAKFEEAGKIHRTDAFLAGLKQAETGKARLLAERSKAAAEAKKVEQAKQLIAEGNSKLDAKDFAGAVTLFKQAKTLTPNDLNAMVGLTRAEQMRRQFEGEAKRKTEEAVRTQNFQRLLKTGQDNLKAKNYEAAVATLGEALKLSPSDPIAQAALKDAQKGYDSALTDAKAKAEAKTRAETYQKHVAAGQLALTTKRYDDAIKSFGDAQKLLPGDKASQDFLQEAQNAKKTFLDGQALAAKQRLAEAKKAEDVRQALTQGRAALATKDLVSAAKLLNQAKTLDPTNADVQRSLKDLDLALQRQAAEAAALKKRDADFKMFVDTGKTALAKNQYAAAIKAFSSATTLLPDNKEAQDLFRRAQNAKQDAEEAAAKADLQKHIAAGLAALKAKNYDLAAKELGLASLAEPMNPDVVKGLKDIEVGRQALQLEKQTQANYLLSVNAGDKAMKMKDYDTAIKAFQQALKWMPSDPSATKLLAQAEQLRAGAAGEAKLQANFKLAMDTGEKAFKLKMYPEAIASFNDALKLIPGDFRAKTLLAQAQQALNAANTEAKTQANFKLAMDLGDKAMKTMNYGAAVKAYGDALKLMPNDLTAKQQLAQAQTAFQIESINQNYTKAMKAGLFYLKTTNYKEALNSFTEALKWIPKDAAALQGQQAAQKGLDSKMKVVPPQPNLFDEAMLRGAALEKEQKYLEAMKAYQDALKIKLKDADALAGMKRSQFNYHVATGQKYLDGGMFVEAQREFETALRIQADPNVQKLLEKAKKKMK